MDLSSEMEWGAPGMFGPPTSLRLRGVWLLNHSPPHNVVDSFMKVGCSVGNALHSSKEDWHHARPSCLWPYSVQWLLGRAESVCSSWLQDEAVDLPFLCIKVERVVLSKFEGVVNYDCGTLGTISLLITARIFPKRICPRSWSRNSPQWNTNCKRPVQVLPRFCW